MRRLRRYASNKIKWFLDYNKNTQSFDASIQQAYRVDELIEELYDFNKRQDIPKLKRQYESLKKELERIEWNLNKARSLEAEIEKITGKRFLGVNDSGPVVMGEDDKGLQYNFEDGKLYDEYGNLIR